MATVVTRQREALGAPTPTRTSVTASRWMNPKAWVSALGAFAAYTTVGGDVLSETSVIAAVLAVFCLISVALWAGFGTVIGRFLAKPRARMAFNWSMAGLLVLSLIPVLW